MRVKRILEQLVSEFRHLFFFALFLSSAVPSICQSVPSSAQQKPSEVRSEEDPTRPLFFSIRPEFYNLQQGAWQSKLIFRYDTEFLKKRRWLGGKKGVILRFEIPMTWSHVLNRTKGGVGDIYGQWLVAPYITRKFAFVLGTGLSLPSASDSSLGNGKWVLAPAVIPLWFIPGKGFFLLKVQNFVSIAGDSHRPDINFLLITPALFYRVRQHWWILADTETKSNWKRDGRTGVKSGLQLGRVITPRFGLWVKPEFWWGTNRDGDWNLKFGLVWYRK